MRPLLALLVLPFLLASGPVHAGSGDSCPCDCPQPSREKSSWTGSWATLSVDSDPRGAEIYIDSEYRGLTPLENARVQAGNVPVTLVKDGFRRLTTQVSLRPGDRRSLGVLPLGNAYGEIFIRSDPPRARVFLDGEKINARTPVTIRRISRDKTHSIRLQLDGYQDWERMITLDDKEKKKFDVELQKQTY